MTIATPSVVDEPWRPLGDAVQSFAAWKAAEQSEPAPMVTQVLVLWEELSFDEDGRPQRRVDYTVPSENFSISGAIGLADAGRTLLKRNGLGGFDDRDD